MRQRDNLIKSACVHVQRMQKALTEMNIQLHRVISDITGTTGMAIINAIVSGERDPKKLAELKDEHPPSELYEYRCCFNWRLSTRTCVYFVTRVRTL